MIGTATTPSLKAARLVVSARRRPRPIRQAPRSGGRQCGPVPPSRSMTAPVGMGHSTSDMTTAATSCAHTTDPASRGRPQRPRPDNRFRARRDPRCGGRPQASRPPRRVLPDDSGAIGRAGSGAGQDCESRESVSRSGDLGARPADQIASGGRVRWSIQGAILRMVPLPTVATIPPSSATEKSPPPLAQGAVCGVVGCERENARRRRRPTVPLVASACRSAARLAADRAAYERSLSATGIPPT